MSRPPGLPDFSHPPLNEVVLGIQFSPPQGYQQIMAGEVWRIFKSRFPIVQEMQSLPPQFETVGLLPVPMFNFGLLSGAKHDRFFFLSSAGEEIIQFQNDRFLRNWRQVPGRPMVSYPRFEALIISFSEDVRRLENYLSSISPQGLLINQCEISYHNRIYMTPEMPFSADWLKSTPLVDERADAFMSNFRRAINRDDGQFQGRAYCEATMSADESGVPFVALVLTARGAPVSHELSDTLEFLTKSRDILVKLFAEVATDSAHKVWGRV